MNQDEHEQHDMVMPGFRFHPTEEELVEFYLRRKVEGKHFNVELITFLDLYSYDPWELPALTGIGEKEWYFYVPRDRKYRNGDRPNRVTTSGYWKATGADRTIRGENSKSIGLKKTLVFYSGKAPKGIRTSWIMTEYRLPHHETERLQKTAEISLCRVYKRAGVEGHARSLPTRLPSSSKSVQSTLEKQQNWSNQTMESSEAYGGSSNQNDEKMSETNASNSTDFENSLVLSNHNTFNTNPLVPITSTVPMQINSMENDERITILRPRSYSLSTDHHLLNYSPQASDIIQDQQRYPNDVPYFLSHFSTLKHPQPQPLNVLPGSIQATFSDGLWDWNANSAASKDYSNLFK
ncbi:unnamed protein product [Fraxinus pennsylvanica]|uniref:NAC domain-containing protein n=1 Tax=Fraxinus pennsylvanica TaxID=56036 RepID=A0AAD2DRJ7_9LAMI|nr:unnamed protein product [Fraxinus pennsylvanica]